ncbi:hypothetical protein NQ315_013086 [Exocentrus adspersus]|uniref:BTB domain-containing protein n=1 Tax=Exocentrus adspersus TaxID=1586481 RepID=A0AAV8VY41_9CUCU|nr:hypothetical protein NQ315_013086 [Exocentrus adspersus]
MVKSLSKAQEGKLKRTEDSDKFSLGNLDLLNLRLNFSSDDTDRNKVKSPSKSPRLRKSEKGSGDTFASRHHHPLEKSETRTLVPNISKLPKVKKKTRAQIIDVVSEDRMSKYNSQFNKIDSGNFPFKLTPSGNLKVESSQVVFSSNKLSVLVADPKNTKINIRPETHNYSKMAHETDFSKTSAMDTIMSQAGFSSLGTLIGNTPVRSGNKEASEYESKQTSEILDPELNLGRLGYSGADEISWQKVVLPEKKNLYLELYSRITNYTNADCKVYIDNEEFNCHLIVLQCYSELFDAYIAVKKVELPSDKCSASAFAFIYEWMITGEPSYRELNRENVLDIFNSAKYLKIKDLVEQCWAFIDHADVFNEDTAFLLYMDAKEKNLPEVRELMLPRIQGFFLMLVSSQNWLELELDDVKNLLMSNYICVNCEMEIFMSAVRWLKHDWSNRDKHKYEVLDCVRFGNIAPWQLVDIKRNPENPDFMELARDPRICKMIDDGLAYVIIKYWYGQENDDFQHWNAVLGLQEPPPRNWSGSDKTYFTYREFLIYLDQYRRNQLIEKNKPRMLNEAKHDNKDYKLRNNATVSEDNSPRVPTMEEFLSKKKENDVNVAHFTEKKCRKPVRTHFTKTKRNRNHQMSKSEAASVIQRAFKTYSRRKLVKKLDKEIMMKFNPDKDVNKKVRRDKVLELFSNQKKSYVSSKWSGGDATRTTLTSVRPNLLTNGSLFQRDKETVLVFGGTDPHNDYGVGRNTGKNIYRYSAEENTWEFVGEMPEPRHHHSIQFLKGRIYVVGGTDPREEEIKSNCTILGSMWSFDPVTKNWFSEPCLHQPRKNFGLVACNHSLYAIGGQGKSYESLKSIEKFNMEERLWESRSSMIYSRIGPACTKYKNYIWVAGGLSGTKKKRNLLDSVESYNVKNDQWTEIRQPLTFPRCFSRMFILSDRLYLIGGAGKSAEKESKETASLGNIDVWDAKNVEWRTITEMHIPRHGHSVACLGTQILIVGGVTTAYKRALSSTECFCSQRGTLVRGLACLPIGLSGHDSVTLPPASLLTH